MRLLRLEFFKCHRRRIALACAAVLAAQLFWFWVVLSRQSAEEMQQGWMLMLYNFPVVDAIMLPIATAVLASRSCEIEHKGCMLKLLETAATPGQLYRAKFFWGALTLAGLLALRGVLLAGIGLTLGFAGAVPAARLILYSVFTWAVSVTLYLLQQGLSLRFANQAPALICGIFGGFAGLMSMLMPSFVQRIVPWSYYGLLSLVGMDWDKTTRITSFYWYQPPMSNFVLLLAWAVLFFVIGRTLFVRKEV